MNARVDLRRLASAPFTSSEASSKSAYDETGEAYLSYADGDSKELYSFEGQYAYGDRRVWELLDSILVNRLKSGLTTISILDAGCGPGTWLRRVVGRARALGYTAIHARGFDLAQGQVERALQLSADLAKMPGVSLVFEVGDLGKPLPEADGSIDLCLCLYAVLNHLPIATSSRALAEFARVTSGHFVSTVRAAGSTPTIYIDSMDRARAFTQDNRADECVVYLHDGKRLAFGSHLFTAAEFRALVEDDFEVRDLCGLDLFHTRFAPDRRWNPPSAEADGRFDRELELLENEYGRNPHFIDRSSHLLVLASPRQAAKRPAPPNEAPNVSVLPKTRERIYSVLKNPRASIW